jgi:hypothetical protein
MLMEAHHHSSMGESQPPQALRFKEERGRMVCPTYHAAPPARGSMKPAM